MVGTYSDLRFPGCFVMSLSLYGKGPFVIGLFEIGSLVMDPMEVYHEYDLRPAGNTPERTE